MSKTRMAAFSDGVLAIIITIMVLELKVPLIYAIAIPVAFLRPWMAGALYVVGALIWIVPDRRIERTVSRPTSPIL